MKCLKKSCRTILGFSEWFLLTLSLATPLLCHADRTLNRPGFQLSFHDEFDGSMLNTSKWNVSIGPNNANNEWEIYATPNVYVTNGALVLESDRLYDGGGNAYYTSGKVTSAGKFDQKYGYFEWTGQVPAGQGFWPAYWMLNYVSWPPEIDVMEMVNYATYCNKMSLHWGPLPPGCTSPWNCGHTEGGDYCGPNFAAGFHTYAVDWEPTGATWYVDGVAAASAPYLGNCTNNMYLIMNTAIGGDWPGPPDGSTPFPSYHRIDCVRVFKPLAGRYPLLNPGFETGEGVRDFNDWNTYDNGNIQSDSLPANARSGNRAVQIWGRYNGQDNTTGIYQDLWAAGGEFWQASVWARNRPGDIPQGGNLSRLKLEFLDNVGNLLTQIQQTILTNTSPANYNQFFVSGIAPFAAARARVVMEYFQTANGAGSVNFDDARLDLLWSPPNALTNGGLESALAGWMPYGASWTNYAVNTDRTIALSGSIYFKVFGQFSGANNFSGMYQDQPAAPGKIYTAEGGAFTLSTDAIAAGNSAWLEVSFRDAATNILALYRSSVLDSTMPANIWLELPITNLYDPFTFALIGSAANLAAPAGTSFVRYQVVFYQPASSPGGSVYFDQLLLRPSGTLASPVITAISPDGSLPFLSAAKALTFTASSPTGIATSAVQVWLNGLDVSSQLAFGGSTNNLNVSLAGIAPNAVYTAVITATNDAGSTATNVTFDTFSQADLTIEAEDFDFSSGQFLDNPAPTSSSAGNSYFGRIGTQSIDENFVSYAGQHIYRPQDNIATEVTADYLRQKYFAAQLTNSAVSDYDVGWWYAGAWLNYTRTVPGNNYNLYARLAGGSGNYSVKLEQVTSGRGTTQQTTQTLGYFSAPGRGWQSWDWVPLLTTNGRIAVVSLAGISTLRATSSGNVNANFCLLAPAPLSVSLQAVMTGNTATLSVPTQNGFSYSVLFKNDLADASWELLKILTGDGTTQSIADATGGAKRFYRVLIQ